MRIVTFYLPGQVLKAEVSQADCTVITLTNLSRKGQIPNTVITTLNSYIRKLPAWNEAIVSRRPNPMGGSNIVIFHVSPDNNVWMRLLGTSQDLRLAYTWDELKSMLD